MVDLFRRLRALFRPRNVFLHISATVPLEDNTRHLSSRTKQLESNAKSRECQFRPETVETSLDEMRFRRPAFSNSTNFAADSSRPMIYMFSLFDTTLALGSICPKPEKIAFVVIYSKKMCAFLRPHVQLLQQRCNRDGTPKAYHARSGRHKTVMSRSLRLQTFHSCGLRYTRHEIPRL